MQVFSYSTKKARSFSRRNSDLDNVAIVNQ